MSGATAFPSSAIINVPSGVVLARKSVGIGPAEEVSISSLLTGVDLGTIESTGAVQGSVIRIGSGVNGYWDANSFTMKGTDYFGLGGSNAALQSTIDSRLYRADSGPGFAIKQADGSTLGTLEATKVIGPDGDGVEMTIQNTVLSSQRLLKLETANVPRWKVDNLGGNAFEPVADNAYAIGSPTKRVSEIYVNDIVASSVNTTQLYAAYSNRGRIDLYSGGQQAGVYSVSLGPAGTGLRVMGDQAVECSTLMHWDGAESQRLNGDAWESYEPTLTAWQAGYRQEASPAGVKSGFFGAVPITRPQITAAGATTADLLAALNSLGLLESI